VPAGVLKIHVAQGHTETPGREQPAEGNQKSGGWGGRILFVLIAGALVYAFFTVPIRGQTPWQHAQRLASSEVVKESAKHKGLSDSRSPSRSRPPPTAPPRQGKTAPPEQHRPEGVDKLTGKDQKELDDLINQKIKKP